MLPSWLLILYILQMFQQLPSHSPNTISEFHCLGNQTLPHSSKRWIQLSEKHLPSSTIPHQKNHQPTKKHILHIHILYIYTYIFINILITWYYIFHQNSTDKSLQPNQPPHVTISATGGWLATAVDGHLAGQRGAGRWFGDDDVTFKPRRAVGLGQGEQNFSPTWSASSLVSDFHETIHGTIMGWTNG